MFNPKLIRPALIVVSALLAVVARKKLKKKDNLTAKVKKAGFKVAQGIKSL